MCYSVWGCYCSHYTEPDSKILFISAVRISLNWLELIQITCFAGDEADLWLISLGHSPHSKLVCDGASLWKLKTGDECHSDSLRLNATVWQKHFCVGHLHISLPSFLLSLRERCSFLQLSSMPIKKLLPASELYSLLFGRTPNSDGLEQRASVVSSG